MQPNEPTETKYVKKIQQRQQQQERPEERERNASWLTHTHNAGRLRTVNFLMSGLFAVSCVHAIEIVRTIYSIDVAKWSTVCALFVISGLLAVLLLWRSLLLLLSQLQCTVCCSVPQLCTLAYVLCAMVNYSVVANGPKDHIILYYLPLFITSFVWNVSNALIACCTRATQKTQSDASSKFSNTYRVRSVWLWINGNATSNQHQHSNMKKSEKTYVFVSFGCLFSIGQINHTSNMPTRVSFFGRHAPHTLAHATLAPLYRFFWFNNGIICKLACLWNCETGFQCCCCLRDRTPINTCKWNEIEATS